jgi:hypothetical protein
MPWRLPSICMLSARMSVAYFSTPFLSVYLRVRRLPSTYTWLPLRRYWPAISASLAKKLMLCHSVASRISPVTLSL